MSAEQCADALWIFAVADSHRRSQHLGCGAVRLALLVLVASDPDGRQLAVSECLVDEARLADAGFADDVDDTTTTIGEGGDRSGKDPPLFGSADEASAPSIGSQLRADGHGHYLRVDATEHHRLPLADRVAGGGAIDRTVRGQDLAGRRACGQSRRQLNRLTKNGEASPL